MQSTYDFFAHGPLPEQTWLPLARRGGATEYRAGEFIYMQGQAPSHFYYLESGRVRSFMSAESGEERQLTVYGQGDIFGEASFFDGLPRVSSAVALTACRVSAIDRDALLACFAEHPDLAVSLLHYLARTVRLLSEHVDRTFLQVPQRLAGYLVRLGRGKNGTIHVSQEELGNAIGASRVAVSRALRDFAARGWVSTGYRCVTVLDAAQLALYPETVI